MRVLIIILSIIAVIFSTVFFMVKEQDFLAFFVDGLILALTAFLLLIMSNNEKRKKAKAEGALDMLPCVHVSGLGIGEFTACDLLCFHDKIEIRELTSKRTFQIPIERLRALEIKSEQEFKELDRSVIGRALVGTLLVPGLGTIVGGMSGLKSKKKGDLKTYLIINYIDKENQLQGVTFENSLNIIRMHNFIKGVNKYISESNGPQMIEL